MGETCVHGCAELTVEYERLAVSLLACRRSLPGSMDHGHFLSELKGSFSILKLGMGYAIFEDFLRVLIKGAG